MTLTETTLKPQQAGNFRVTALASTTTSLEWDPSAGPAPIAYYSLIDEIYTGQVTNTLEASLTGITNFSLAFTGQTPGSTQYYFLYAHDGSGNSSSAAILTTHNPVPTPVALSNPTLLVSGGFQFTAQGSAVQTTLIQATTNLADPTSWEAIATNPPTNSTSIFTDGDAGLFPTRFHRVISP